MSLSTITKFLILVSLLLMAGRLPAANSQVGTGPSSILLASHSPTYRQRLLFALADVWTGDKGPIIDFTIAPDGSLSSVTVTKSCGDEMLDNRALEAVKGTPLPALPEWTKVRPFTKPITFHFDMSKLHTGNITDAVVRPGSQPADNVISPPVCTTPAGRQLTAQAKTVREDIASWWKSAAFQVSAPVLQFDLQADGTIRNPKILRSSNSSSTDQAIIEKFQVIRFPSCPEINKLISDHGLRMKVDLQSGETPPEYIHTTITPGTRP